MKKTFLFAVLLSAASCLASPAHWFWPQKDIENFTIRGSSTSIRVLISSRKSDFKTAVVTALTDSLKKDSANIKAVGLGDLKDEKQEHYDVVVIINTVMGFGMDPKVKNFLKKQKNRKSIIVLFTSGKGSWMPKTEDRDYDAVSAASKTTAVKPAVWKIMNKIRDIVER